MVHVVTRQEAWRRTAIEIIRRMGSETPRWLVALLSDKRISVQVQSVAPWTPASLVECYRLWTVPEPRWDGPTAWTPALRTTGNWGVMSPNGEAWVGPRLSRAGARRFAQIVGGKAVDWTEAAKELKPFLNGGCHDGQTAK